MPETAVPKPLSAYVGLLVASLEGAKGEGRSAAAQVAHLPLAAAGQLLTVRKRYDELAETGGVIIDVVVGMVRQRFGAGTEETSDWVGDEFAAMRERVADSLDETAERLDAVADRIAGDADPSEPSPEPTPAPTPAQQLEQFSVPEEIGAAAGGLKSAADLPLADFDHMSGPQLRGRLRTLDRVQLVQLLDYERAHANRVGIVVMLENRLNKLIA